MNKLLTMTRSIFSLARVVPISLAFGLLAAGCSQSSEPMPDRAQRITQGYIYYLDGAGGGSALSNWSGGLKQGMLDAGYPGAGEMFDWNTGMGVITDQDSSVDYKRGKAAECAQLIKQYKNDHAGAPVTLIGLSAGTAVTVFVLEALPTSCPVENVVLCGASIGADYDLTKAMQRVRNHMYVFTSENDAVLSFLVPMAGTADRQEGDVPSAGLRGFQMPTTGLASTEAAYAKVSYIRWNSNFERFGDFGGHTDALKAPFVQHYMAPLIMDGMARRLQAASATGKVPNPDYDRWSRFGPGSYVTYDGYQEVGGVKQPLRLTAKLVSKHEDRLVVERTYIPSGKNAPVRVQHFLIDAQIKPGDHPLTSSTAKISDLPDETLTVAGRKLSCHVRTVQATGMFPDYGQGVSVTLYQNETVPGGTVRLWLRSSKDNQPFEFRGDAVEYAAR